MPTTALIIVLAIVVLFLLNAIKIVREYERVVVFRLGRLQGAKGPGSSSSSPSSIKWSKWTCGP